MVNDYRDNALVTAAFRGNDLITFVVAIPLLLHAGNNYSTSARARLVWLGLVGYALYNYAFYLFGAAFNDVFLVYAAIVVISTATLILCVSSGSLRSVAPTVLAQSVSKSVAAFLMFFALLIGGLWISRSVSFVLTGQVPDDITRTGHPTGIVYALDLTLLVPSVMTAAIWLWCGRRWGHALGIVVCIKATTYSIALIAMSYFADRAGIAGAWDLTALWAALGAGTLVSAILLLRRVEPELAASSRYDHSVAGNPS